MAHGPSILLPEAALGWNQEAEWSSPPSIFSSLTQRPVTTAQWPRERLGCRRERDPTPPRASARERPAWPVTKKALLYRLLQGGLGAQGLLPRP